MRRSEATDVALATVSALLVALAFWLLGALQGVLLTFFTGLLLATALQRPVDWLRERGLSRPLAAAVAVLTLVGLVIAFLTALLPPAAAQTARLVADLPDYYANMRAGLLDAGHYLVRQFGAALPRQLPQSEAPISDTAAGLLGWAATTGLIFTVSTPLLTFYWLVYRDRAVQGLLRLLPLERRAAAGELWRQIEEKLGAFLRSQVLLMLIIGVASLIGFLIIGLPFALLIALITAILEIVPFVGPTVATILAVIVGFNVSFSMGVSTLVVGLILQQAEANLLAPRIVDRVVGISPVAALTLIIAFTNLFGLAGAILAVPLAAVAQVLFERWLAARDSLPDRDAVEGRDLTARLRYQARRIRRELGLRMRQKSTDVGDEADRDEEELERIIVGAELLLARQSAGGQP